MQKIIFSGVILLLMNKQSMAQSLAVNTTGAAANASAIVDITSTTKGLLIPRMLQAERDLIGSPSTGLMIYQTNNTPGFYQYNGSTWVQLNNGFNWSVMGNAGTSASTNFMGSTDNVDVAFRANNTEIMRMLAGTQRLGLGTAAPSQKFHVSDPTTPNAATIRVSGLANTTTLALGTAPFTSLMVDANGILYRGGTTGSPGTAWLTTGNAGTAAATNFMGSTDNVDIAFRTNNTEAFRMTNGQKLLIGVNTPTAPTTQKLEVFAASGDAIYGRSPNIGGWLGYETNFSFGTPAQNLSGAGVYATNNAAGYTSSFFSSSGSATVAANINYSNVWIANYNQADNASSTVNPSASYNQLNVTNSALGGTQIALKGFSERGTTAGNPGYTYGVQGIANAQNQDAIGVQGLAYTNAPVSIGGYFEGLNYLGTSIAYAYVGGWTNGATARKIVGTGTVSEIIPTARHGRVTLTCPESPEYWYQDYGSVKMINGKAHVSLDPILADVVFINEENPIRVFCTPVDMLYFNGVTIVNQTPTGFDLVELNGGTHSGKLDYQIVVKPKTNYGEGRFPQAPGPAWVKGEKELIAAKAKNNPADGRKVFMWPPETETYNYKPEDLVGIGEEVHGGPYHGMIKMADGTFKPANPVDKNSITNKKNN